MKILFNTYPMAFHTPGGGEIQLLAYRRYLSQIEINVSLLDLWKPEFETHDLVHFFSCMGGSSHFCAFVKSLGKPLVVSSSLWVTENTMSMYPINEIRNQLSFADFIVTNSNIECETLSRVLNISREKFGTVYNGVDHIFFDDIAPTIFRRYFKIDGPFVLNVGNIEPRKNQYALAKAMKEFPELKLVLIGHARDPVYLNKILEIGKRQVIYVGALKSGGELLRSAYKACDLFCLPSTLETPGLAALEYAASGGRLVITEIGSTKEYFGDSAIYINPFSIDSIVHSIKNAFETERKESLNIRIKNNYFWGKTILALKDIYFRLCSK